METGKPLDALVAEKVMGFEPWPTQNSEWPCTRFKAPVVPPGCEPRPCEPPDYSADFEAARDVLARMKELGWAHSMQDASWGQAECKFIELNGSRAVVGASESLATAICLAALKACGQET